MLTALTAAHEQIQPLLDHQQLFIQCCCDRLHGALVEPHQTVITLGRGRLGLSPQVVKLVLLDQGMQTRAVAGTLGHIEQQVTYQLGIRLTLANAVRFFQ